MTHFDHQLSERKRGHGNRWKPVLLVAAAVVLYLAYARTDPKLEGWGADFGAAIRDASADGKRILIAFYMPGCAPCTIMDRSVLPDRKVKQALREFELVRIDATVQTEIAARYEVYATPTFAVVDDQGRLLSKREGTLTVEEFVDFVQRAASLPDRAPPAVPASEGAAG